MLDEGVLQKTMSHPNQKKTICEVFAQIFCLFSILAHLIMGKTICYHKPRYMIFP